MPYWAFIYLGYRIYMPLWAISIMDDKLNKGRPKCRRNVTGVPEVTFFKPRGIPLVDLESVELKLEELESLKKVYYDKLDRETVASAMGVSRRTMERELKSGIFKVVDALVNGKAIEINGGYYKSGDELVFRCLDERHEWKQDKFKKVPKECPTCGSKKIIKK